MRKTRWLAAIVIMTCAGLSVYAGEQAAHTSLAMALPAYPPAGGIWLNAPTKGMPPVLHGKPLHTVVFVTNRDSGDVVVIDAATDKIVNRIKLEAWTNAHMAMPAESKATGERRLVVSGPNNSVFYVLDLDKNTGKAVPTDLGPEHFDVAPDGDLAYVGNLEGGTVSAIDLNKGVEIARIPGFFEPHGVSFHPTEPKAYISNLGAHEIGVVDTREHKLIKRIAVGNLSSLAALNPDRFLTNIQGIVHPVLTMDGRYIYASDGDSNQVAVIDTKTDEVVKTIPVGLQPWRAYASPDGKWMLIPNNGDETVSIIDTKTQEVTATVPGGAGMTGVNYGLGGKKAYVIASNDSAVFVYDLNGFHSKKIFIGKNLKLETASTTPDGKKVYLASSTDNSVYVIETQTDIVKRIPNVGQSPWAVSIMEGENYCH